MVYLQEDCAVDPIVRVIVESCLHHVKGNVFFQLTNCFVLQMV